MNKEISAVKELEELKKAYDKMFIEVLNTNSKLRTMGYLLKEFSLNTLMFDFKEKQITEIQSEVQEFIESIGLMMLDNANNLQQLIDKEGSR